MSSPTNAADAGIEAVISDIPQGTNVLDGSYVISNVFLNHLTTTITTSAAPRTAMVPCGPSFADPGTASGGGLSPLASTTQFLYEITNVQGNFIFQINWSFTPSGSWGLNVYEGSGTGGNQIASTSGSDSPGRLIVPESDISGGTYTIRFYNNSVSATTSEEFSTAGDTSKTWVRSRVPGSGVRGRGSGERETTASSLAGKEESSRKGGQRWSRKGWTCWSYCARGEWTVTWTSYGRH